MAYSVGKHRRIANELKFAKYSNVICKIHLSNNVLENVDTVGEEISNKNFSFQLAAYTSALFAVANWSSINSTEVVYK